MNDPHRNDEEVSINLKRAIGMLSKFRIPDTLDTFLTCDVSPCVAGPADNAPITPKIASPDSAKSVPSIFLFPPPIEFNDSVKRLRTHRQHVLRMTGRGEEYRGGTLKWNYLTSDMNV